MANGKEFFLKRWMRSLVEWLDGQLFSMADTDYQTNKECHCKHLCNKFECWFLSWCCH